MHLGMAHDELLVYNIKCQLQYSAAQVGLLLCGLRLPAKHFAAPLNLVVHDLQLPAQHCAAKEKLYHDLHAQDAYSEADSQCV